MLIARSVSAGTRLASGSLVPTALRPTVTEGRPPKVITRSVPGRTAAPVSRRATWTAPITSGRSPYSLVRRRRRRSPPSAGRRSAPRPTPRCPLPFLVSEAEAQALAAQGGAHDLPDGAIGVGRHPIH